jgi:hypothetical protein
VEIVVGSTPVSHETVTTALPFRCGAGRYFQIPRGSIFETYNAMNWKKFILLACVVACVFAASTATAQMRGHGNSMTRMRMRGTFMPRSMTRMPMRRAPMFRARAPMLMRHAPMRNSAFGFHRFNDGDFDRDDRFHHFNHFNDIIIFDNFGFPFFPFPPFPPF